MKPYGYVVEQPDGHTTFFKEDPTAFRATGWPELGVVIHDLYPRCEDTARLDWMEKSLLREASMRFPDGSFKAVNAWSIASARTDLREAIDAAMKEGAA